MNAKQARKIMADSDKYLASELEKIYKEVESQASKGIDWANVNIPANSHIEFCRRIKDELRILGYQVNNHSGGDEVTAFQIKW